MDRTFSKYTAPRGGVKVARRALIAVLVACSVLATDAATTFSQSPDSTETRDEEPKAVFVNRIRFHGNDNVKDSQLKARMRTREPGLFAVFNKPRLDERQLGKDIKALEAYYRSLGFPDATVRLDQIEYLENRRFADIHIKVTEGEPNRVSAVTFEGNLILEEKDLRKDLLLEPGAPFNEALLETDIYTIRGRYFDQGYLAVAIEDVVGLSEHKVDIRFLIEPGPMLKVGTIAIDGNENVRTGVIESEITVEPGDICRYNKVLETERNLFETGLFSVVDVLPENVDTLTHVVDLRVRVRERKESWLEAGFGVGNVLGSRVFAEWGTRNLFGTGRTVRLRATYAFDLFEGDEIGVDKIDISNTYWRYDAIYQQRRVLGLKLPTSFNAYYYWDATVPELEEKTIGGAVSVTHEFGPYRDFGRENQLVGTFSVEDIRTKETGKPEERSRSNILGSSVSRDTRDFILNPTVGLYEVASAQIAGGILGGQNDFYTAESSFQHYTGVSSRSVFAWRVRVGYADSYGRSAEVPIGNRYFLGGANSVRGYGESSLGPVDAEGDPAGGTVLLLANVELRFLMPFIGKWNFSGAVFLDSGNVWKDFDDIDSSDFELFSSLGETTQNDYRYGSGVGIRYNTPIGPIRLDWGFPLKPDMDNSGGKVYLSLGQIF